MTTVHVCPGHARPGSERPACFTIGSVISGHEDKVAPAALPPTDAAGTPEGNGSGGGVRLWLASQAEETCPELGAWTTGGPRIHQRRLSAWESDRITRPGVLTWRYECPLLTVTDPWSPRLMARRS
jgi:hypothetical protein